MYIKRAEISEFRNIGRAEIEADGELNILHGENAQGKTNVLEALWLFTGAKSFRGSKDAQTVKAGSGKARLRENFYAWNRDQTAEITVTNRREFTLNGVGPKSGGEIAGTAPAVVFSPDDIRLVNGGPGERRRLLDVGIGFIYPAYIEKLRRYWRALKQRNAVLREIKTGGSRFDCLPEYDEIISEAGAEITRIRKAYADLLKTMLPDIYGGISGGRETFDISYAASGGESAAEFAKKLRKNRDEDVKCAATGTGPHRDDLNLKIDGKVARMYASQGQRRSVALALKLAQAEAQKAKTGESPVVLLDDVLSELDAGRRSYILNRVKPWQVFITCCDPETITEKAKGKKFTVKGGEVREG